MKKESIFFKIGFLLSSYLGLLLFLYCLLSVLKFNIYFNIVNIVSFATSIIMYFLFVKKEFNKNNIIPVIIFTFIILVLPFLYSYTFDDSCDGNSYHKTAIGYIKNGWNTYYEDAEEFYKSNKDVPEIDSKTALWIEHYPKATWVISAFMYSMTGSIESGKSLTMILSVLLFFMSYNILSKYLNKKISLFYSLLLTINPVVLVQLFNYYLDGTLGICFALQIMLLFLINKEDKIYYWIMLLSVVMIMTNLKFTGLLYTGIISMIFYCLNLIKLFKIKNYKKIYSITIKFSVVYLIAILLIGGNSYLKNTIDHRNPLYPLMGEGKVDIVTSMQPQSFENMSSTEKFLTSLFSKTSNISYASGLKPELKLPFMVYRSELNELISPDTRISGMGPWFTLTLFVSLISIVIAFIKLRKVNKNFAKTIFIIFITIIISMLVLSERWWARYVPQLYFIPILSLITISLTKTKNKNIKFYNLLIYGISFVLIINSLLFVYVNRNKINQFIIARNDLIEMSNKSEVKLKLTTNDFYGIYFNLKDYKINYKVVDNLKEESTRYKFNWKVAIEDE